MKDVARLSGVSLGTVSNVLNGNPAVSAENRGKVLDAINKLNYTPNFAARALKTNKSKTIGLVIPDINNPFYPEFARGAEDAAQACGYALFLCNSDRNIEKERGYITALSEKMVDGIILFKTHLPVNELEVLCSSMKVVLADYGRNSRLNCGIIKIDDYKGVYSAFEYLWQKKHRRIAMIAGRLDSQSAKDRVRSYRDFIAARKIKIPPEFIQAGNYDRQSGYDCAAALLEIKNPPTSIFAANDLMALGAIQAAGEIGFKTPRDISIIGFDDIEMAAFSVPALTTVRQPKYEMGQYSTQALIRRIENPDSGIGKQTIKILETQLMERQSAGLPGSKR